MGVVYIRSRLLCVPREALALLPEPPPLLRPDDDSNEHWRTRRAVRVGHEGGVGPFLVEPTPRLNRWLVIATLDGWSALSNQCDPKSCMDPYLDQRRIAGKDVPPFRMLLDQLPGIWPGRSFPFLVCWLNRWRMRMLLEHSINSAVEYDLHHLLQGDTRGGGTTERRSDDLVTAIGGLDDGAGEPAVVIWVDGG